MEDGTDSESEPSYLRPLLEALDAELSRRGASQIQTDWVLSVE